MMNYVSLTMLALLLLLGTTTALDPIKMGILLSGSGWQTGNDTYDAAILAIQHLKDQLGVEIEHRVDISNCDVVTSYRAAHDLLEWGAKVIIGPACTTTCIPVSLLALQYEVPVISYACSGTELSNRDTYPNFGRTSESLTAASGLLKSAFEEWDFQLYSVMTTTQAINVDFAIDVVTTMRGQDKDSRLAQLSTAVKNINSTGTAEVVRDETKDQVHSLMSDSWVFFLPMYDSDASWVLQNAAEKAVSDYGASKTNPWGTSNFAWFRYQSLIKDYKYIYDGVFSLENDSPHITYPEAYKDFLENRMGKDTTWLEKGEANLPIYLAYMYNAIVAWGQAYKAYGNWSYNGIINEMVNMTYQGAYREETLDGIAEPANPIWVIKQYQVENDVGEWVQVVSQDTENSSIIYINDSLLKWPNGKKVDACKDGRCNEGTNNTVLYVVVAVCILLVVVVVAVSMFIVHRHKQQSTDDLKVNWKIAYTEIDFAVKKSVSGSRKMIGGDEPNASAMQVAKYDHHLVVVKNLNMSNIIITKEILEDLNMLKRMTHPNLNTFYGLCDDPGYVSVITAFCSKGSLEDLTHNENVHLDWMFKLSLIIDVAKGLRHLHATDFGYHGNLRTSLCVVDSHWVCKLSDFGMRHIMKDSLGANGNSSGNNNNSSNVRDLFYKAPEMLWPSSKERTVKEVQKCDTYSLAIIMYELYAREPPYDTSEMLPEKIINKIRNRESPPFRPNLDRIEITKSTSHEHMGSEDSANAVPVEAVDLMKHCWSEMPFERINISDTVEALEDMNPDRSLSITDRVVKMMEKYSEDLEDKVHKKTLQLQNQKAGRNLSRFLPKKIIEKIENGLEVESPTDRTVTGVCLRVKMQNDIDQIAASAIDAYERFNHTEIESRNIYQVIDSHGQPVIVSGIYEDESSPDTLVEYLQVLHQYGRSNNISLKVAMHSGQVSYGLVMADRANPRLCMTGSFTEDLSALLEATKFDEVLITDASRQVLSADVKTSEHVKVKLTGEQLSTTHLLHLPQTKKLTSAHSAPPLPHPNRESVASSAPSDATGTGSVAV